MIELKKCIVMIDGGFFEERVKENANGKCIAIRPFLADLIKIYGPVLSPQISFNCVRTYYYDGIPNPLYIEKFKKADRERLRKKMVFLEALEKECNFVEVRTGLVKPSSNSKNKQKAVDVKMGTDMARFASSGKVDTIFLIAGDGDFVPAVELAKQEMVNVYLISQEKHVSEELRKSVDISYLKMVEYFKPEKLLHDCQEIDEELRFPIY